MMQKTERHDDANLPLFLDLQHRAKKTLVFFKNLLYNSHRQRRQKDIGELYSLGVSFINMNSRRKFHE